MGRVRNFFVCILSKVEQALSQSMRRPIKDFFEPLRRDHLHAGTRTQGLRGHRAKSPSLVVDLLETASVGGGAQKHAGTLDDPCQVAKARANESRRANGESG